MSNYVRRFAYQVQINVKILLILIEAKSKNIIFVIPNKVNNCEEDKTNQ